MSAAGTLAGMDIVGQLYYYTDQVLFWGMVALWLWAFGDCLTRKAAAFPAVDKLTKPAWLAILLIAGLLGYFFSSPLYPSTTVSVFALIATVVASVYLADVRPAVREISSGR